MQNIEDRVARLERANRRMRLALIGAVFAGLALVGVAMQSEDSPPPHEDENAQYQELLQQVADFEATLPPVAQVRECLECRRNDDSVSVSADTRFDGGTSAVHMSADGAHAEVSALHTSTESDQWHVKYATMAATTPDNAAPGVILVHAPSKTTLDREGVKLQMFLNDKRINASASWIDLLVPLDAAVWTVTDTSSGQTIAAGRDQVLTWAIDAWEKVESSRGGQ